MLSRILFRLSRSALFGKIVGFCFEHGGSLMPVSTLRRTDRTLVFDHPKPTFKSHILLVPRKAIPTFTDLVSPGHLPYLSEVIRLAADIVREQNWPVYSLGVNGGPYQDVPQVHFHLYQERSFYREINDPSLFDPASAEKPDTIDHPQPSRAIHRLIRCSAAENPKKSTDPPSETFASLPPLFHDMVQKDNLLVQGYTVFVQWTDGADLIFHVVSGGET